MALSLEQMKARRPVDTERVAALKQEMIEAVHAYQLRELREAVALTQQSLAELMDISQRAVSKIERGDIERCHIDTLRRYVEGVGGRLHVEVEVGDRRLPIA